MAQSLLQQLLVRSETRKIVQQYLFDTFVNSNEVLLQTFKQAKSLLQMCLRAVGTSCIAIDGLDECPEQEQQRVVEFMQRHISDTGEDREPSRCIIFSQDDGNTRPLLQKPNISVIRIAESDALPEIHRFCVDKAAAIQQKFRLTDPERNELARGVAGQSEGTETSIHTQPCCLQRSSAILASNILNRDVLVRNVGH
jgi:hypothetical protein